MCWERCRVIRAFYPLLAQSERPRIVNVSSGLGSISTRKGHDHYAYSASKAALNMLTRTIANELAPRGVTTVAISPGGSGQIWEVKKPPFRPRNRLKPWPKRSKKLGRN